MQTDQRLTLSAHCCEQHTAAPQQRHAGRKTESQLAMLSHCVLNLVGGRGGAGAMLNAVTALEGLLPILPVEAVRQQVIKARQVLVQAAMLAEAPSLSAAAAGGPAEETQPSLLVDMLLSLLLQVQPFHALLTAMFCWHQAEWEQALASH